MAMGKMPGERQEELFIAASGVGALGRKRPKLVFPHNPGRLCAAFVTHN